MLQGFSVFADFEKFFRNSGFFLIKERSLSSWEVYEGSNHNETKKEEHSYTFFFNTSFCQAKIKSDGCSLSLDNSKINQ